MTIWGNVLFCSSTSCWEIFISRVSFAPKLLPPPYFGCGIQTLDARNRDWFYSRDILAHLLWILND